MTYSYLCDLIFTIGIEYPSFNPNYRNKYDFSISNPASKLLNGWIKVEDQGKKLKLLSESLLIK